MMLPVTLTIAAAAGLGNLILAYRIVRVRLKDQILLGDGGDPALVARTRAQANFVEYAPFVLILMALIEAAGGDPDWLWGAGGLFVVSRIVHAIGMDRPTANPWRAGGALLTWAVLLALSIWGLALAWTGASSPPVRAIPVEAVPTA